MLEKVKEICAESNLEIPDSNLDRAHRIGKPYFDKIKKVKWKSIIVRFNTFRHRTLVYMAKKDIKQKKSHKIRLDLTKRCYLMLSEATKLASDNQNNKFCYVDGNCWNDNQEDFFDTLEDLRNLLDRSCRLLYLLIKCLYYLLELLLVKSCSNKASGKFCVNVCEEAIEWWFVEQVFCIFVRGPWVDF